MEIEAPTATPTIPNAEETPTTIEMTLDQSEPVPRPDSTEPHPPIRHNDGILSKQ
ncbi:hypothetical protein C2G38_2095221 [Gigaspora rosea]|uniref:Uncharacterized protein n=1 Tax=Gigaspora rosea TaxID=44941 RepID=A0A397U567_9GLOM|nr:hypothetical protein C2G38_2118406 [Gigaspora rosea]RIB14666.1 hypothetical protein C2G38_2095221 [Gigaspora rosea]